MMDGTSDAGLKPPSNLTSLRARLRNHAREIAEIETRVQRRLAALVVNEIFLSVDSGDDGPPVLVKGGTAIDLRRGASPARLSKDWDAAVRCDLERFLADARSALIEGWSGFTGRMTREFEIDVPGLSAQPRRFEVKLDYHGKPFATVPVELSPAEGRSGTEYDPVSITEYSAIGLEPRRAHVLPVAALPDRPKNPRVHRPTRWAPRQRPCSRPGRLTASGPTPRSHTVGCGPRGLHRDLRRTRAPRLAAESQRLAGLAEAVLGRHRKPWKRRTSRHQCRSRLASELYQHHRPGR